MATLGYIPKWFFIGDSKTWIAYDSYSNDVIEQAYQARDRLVNLIVHGRPYIIDFVQMEQTNKQYGTVRKVLRDETGTMPSSPIVSVPVPYSARMSYAPATSGVIFPSRIPVSLPPYGAGYYFGSVPHSATILPPSPLGGDTSPIATSLPPTGTKPVPLSYGATIQSESPYYQNISAPTNPIKSGTKTGTKSDLVPTTAPIIADNSPSMPRKKSKSELTKNFGSYDSFFRKYTEIKSQKSLPKDESCPICITSLLEPADIDVPTKSHSSSLPLEVICGLKKCSHLFHVICIGTMLDAMPKVKLNELSISCPICQTIHGVKTGDQPLTGTMNTRQELYSVPGYQDSQTIAIRYAFSDGISESGTRYSAAGFPRVCFVPDCPEGRIVVKLLELAWKRRLIFTIGTSVTTGRQNCIVWNNIHHKTEPHSNTSGHGFPDPNFLKNIKMELAVQGVTEDEL